MCVYTFCCSSLRAQATAQCGHKAEAAGSMVFPGPDVLPASQTLHPGRHGGSGKPHVQQQEDRAYPHGPPVVKPSPEFVQLEAPCSDEYFKFETPALFSLIMFA